MLGVFGALQDLAGFLHQADSSLAVGETDNPQGVVNTSDGRVVRAFHRFTLVDQLNQNRDLTKGRRRDQGAVKISCARQVQTNPGNSGVPPTTELTCCACSPRSLWTLSIFSLLAVFE